MKKQTLLLLATLLPLSAASAQTTTTWDGAGNWFSPDSWDNGIPDITKDAVVIKTTQPDQALTSAAAGTPPILVRDLNISSESDEAPTGNNNRLRIYIHGGTTGRDLTAATSKQGKLSLFFYGASNFTGGISLSSSSSVARNLTLSLNPGTTLTAAEGISLGGNSGNNAGITHGNLGTEGATINGNITFNNGSYFAATNNDGANSKFFLNGNVTLQSGGYSGAGPGFEVGRSNQTDRNFSVLIRDHLSVSAGYAHVFKEKTLQVSSATISAGGGLRMGGWGSSQSGLYAEEDAIFHSLGTLAISGGTYSAVNSTGTAGSYVLDIDGDFILGTGSTMTLRSDATGITTLRLAGNLDLQATSLASGNLNQLRVVLDGTEPQTLEAAVLGGNETFAVHTLTLGASVDLVSLVDEHLNLGDGEFFKTANLVNIGNTVLNIGDLGFYVGDTLLEAGTTYSTYGGSLTVIPEPSTFALLGGTLGFALLRRRRK